MEPQLEDDERMVYVAFSEFFFDSAMESYFQAGALQLTLVGDKVDQGLSEGGIRRAHDRESQSNYSISFLIPLFRCQVIWTCF